MVVRVLLYDPEPKYRINECSRSRIFCSTAVVNCRLLAQAHLFTIFRLEETAGILKVRA